MCKENTIATAIYVDVMVDVGISCPANLFKITNIVFPPNIIQTALQSAIALQNNEIATNQQFVDVYIIGTQQIVAQINADSKQIIQESIYESSRIVSLSQYNYDNMINSARGKGIAYFMNDLGIKNFLNGTYLDEFVNVLALIENNNKTIFSGLDGVSMIINK
jgi:hypothetical protein